MPSEILILQNTLRKTLGLYGVDSRAPEACRAPHRPKAQVRTSIQLQERHATTRAASHTRTIFVLGANDSLKNDIRFTSDTQRLSFAPGQPLWVFLRSFQYLQPIGRFTSLQGAPAHGPYLQSGSSTRSATD